MKLYLCRDSEYLCIDHSLFKDTLNLAKLFGDHEVPFWSSLTLNDFGSQEEGAELWLEEIYSVSSSVAHALGHVTERALSSDKGVQCVLGFLLKDCVASDGMGALMAQYGSSQSSSSQWSGANETAGILGQFADFRCGLICDPHYPGNVHLFIRALKTLRSSKYRKVLRQLVSFCRWGSFTLARELPPEHRLGASGAT